MAIGAGIDYDVLALWQSLAADVMPVLVPGVGE